MRLLISFPLSLLMLSAALPAHGQNQIGTGAVAELYNLHCAVCHGGALEGGLGPNLIDAEWVHGNRDEDIARVIREGVLEQGMMGYGDILNEQQIRSLVVYLREVAQIASVQPSPASAPQDGVYSSTHYNFRLEEIVRIDGDIFWSVSFLPDGTMLLARFSGKLHLFRDGVLSEPVKGLPQVYRHGQGGLMEAQAHPDYERNGWIYLGYTDAIQEAGGDRMSYMTKVVRGRVRDGKWVDEELIFRAPDRTYRRAGVHFGTRFVFKDGYLFFSIGDRGVQNEAQDLSLPNGKVHRIHDDGRIPADNPFVGREGAFPSIWSYGNRNIQGLDLHPETGELWATEHGPRGGDELNRIGKGLNYGWPVITHGLNYNGTPITGITEAPGMEQPVHQWTPSIAVCGIDFHEGGLFAQWRNDLFVGGLRSEQLERFRLRDGKIVEHEIVLKGMGRIRDVSTGPDGSIYLILNKDRNAGPSRVYRIVPVG